MTVDWYKLQYGFRVIYVLRSWCVASETHVIAGEPVTISAQPGPRPRRTQLTPLEQAPEPAGKWQDSSARNEGLASGVVTVRCRATDGEGRVAEASVDVDVVAPEAKAKTVQLCSVYFKHYPKLPTRVITRQGLPRSGCTQSETRSRITPSDGGRIFCDKENFKN